MASAMPQITMTKERIRCALALKPLTLTDRLEKSVERAQELAVNVLFGMTLGIAFCMWSPLLLIFASLLPVLWSISIEVFDRLQWFNAIEVGGDTELQQQAKLLENLVTRLKVPVPTQLFGGVVLSVATLGTVIVLLEFGFGLGGWIALGIVVVFCSIWSRQHHEEFLPHQAVVDFVHAPVTVCFVKRDPYASATNEVDFAQGICSDY